MTYLQQQITSFTSFKKKKSRPLLIQKSYKTVHYPKVIQNSAHKLKVNVVI